MIENKLTVGVFILLLILFFSCDYKKDSKETHSSISFEELKFVLPDDSFYPSEATALNDSFYFLDFRGQRLMKYESQTSKPLIWDISKFNFDQNLNFNLLFKYSHDRLFLYSSRSKKALTIKDDFSDPKLIDLTWLEKDLLFTSGGNLILDEESIILPAISYEDNGMILSIIKINPSQKKFSEVTRFSEAVDPNIPSMFYHPYIARFEKNLLLYFPTLQNPIKFNSENQLIEKEFLAKELLEKFNYENFLEIPLYFYQFSFYYYSAFNEKIVMRLKNKKLDKSSNNPKVVLEITDFNQNDVASFSIPDSLFHKSIFLKGDSFYFLNQILTNKKEDFIYVNKIRID